MVEGGGLQRVGSGVVFFGDLDLDGAEEGFGSGFFGFHGEVGLVLERISFYYSEIQRVVYVGCGLCRKFYQKDDIRDGVR